MHLKATFKIFNRLRLKLHKHNSFHSLHPCVGFEGLKGYNPTSGLDTKYTQCVNLLY